MTVLKYSACVLYALLTCLLMAPLYAELADLPEPLSHPELIRGGQTPRFICVDMCTNLDVPGEGICVPKDGADQPLPACTAVNNLCGYERKNRQTVWQCQLVQLQGTKVVCMNPGAQGHCYQARPCKCTGGPVFTCSFTAGAFQNAGFKLKAQAGHCP